jgi:hypothetical protein
VSAHAAQRGPGLWDEVCSPKMQRRPLLALADLFVINRPHTLVMLLFFHMHRPHADLSLILVPAALARAESPAGDQEAAVVTDLL